MKRVSVWFLALALLVSLATPVLAANETVVATPATEEAVDAAWQQAWQQGYNLGLADAKAGKAYVEMPYGDDDVSIAKSIGYDEGYNAYQADMDKQTKLKNLGGTPGKINVRLNDKCVAFPDAFPELKNDRTMIPVRAVVEALKATVETPDAKTVKITLGDTVVTLTIGDVKVNVEKAGKTQTITLDAAPYIKNDRTHVPLRFISETFGYDVMWDQDYQTVVILDSKAMKAKMNERLSTLNLFLKSQGKYLVGNWKSEGTMDMTLEIIDTINGNKTYTIPGKMTSHMGGGAATMDANMDFSSLLPLFQKLAADAALTDADGAALLKNIAKNQTISMKMLPDGDMYLKSGLYDLMFQEILGADFDRSKETWYQFPNMGADMLKVENYNVGALIYSSVTSQASMTGELASYDQMMEAERQLVALMGNDTFKKQGDTYVWSIDKAKVLSMFKDDPEIAAEVSKMLQEVNLKLTFTEAGTYSMSGTLKIDVAGLGSLLTMSLDANGNTNGDDNASMQVQIRNLFNFGMKAKSKTWQVSDAPVVTIPQNAQIIDIMDLLNGY